MKQWQKWWRVLQFVYAEEDEEFVEEIDTKEIIRIFNRYDMYSYMVEIQQRGIEFLRSVQKVGTSYRALGLAERSSSKLYSRPNIMYLLYIVVSSERNERNDARGIDDGKVPADVVRGDPISIRGFISDRSIRRPFQDADFVEVSHVARNEPVQRKRSLFREQSAHVAS